MRGTALAMLAIAFSAPALAAEVTDMPPELRGDLSVDYRGAFLFGSIEEDQWGYGRRRIARHDVVYTLEFAPMPGIAFNAAIDTTPYMTYSFPEEADLLCAEGYGCEGPTKMRYDPVLGTGTYVDSELLDSNLVPKYEGGGVNGLWLGAAFAPFSEEFKRKQRVTWRLDFGYRLPNRNSTFWNLRADGTRGTAPGGQALKFGAAFSTDNGIANPYLAMQYIAEGAFRLPEYRDHTGTLWGTDLRIRPQSRFDARAGVELVPYDDREIGGRFAFDLYMGFGYRSWQDIPSGILLPDVLDNTKGKIVTEDEHIVGYGGLGFDHHIVKYVTWRAALDCKYFTPHHLEHLYAARSDYDTVEFALVSSLEIRIR